MKDELVMRKNMFSAMDNVITAFFKISQIIKQFGQMGQMICVVFGVFPVELSAHILSLCVPSS